MGRGSRHSKNAGTMGSESMTYAEMKGLGYGTRNERLGKDAVGNYYDCRLTLRPATDPVCTPDGYMFSREAILENLLQQKKANKRRFAAWEAQQQDEQRKLTEREAVEVQTQLLAFDRQNHMGASDSLAKSLKKAIKEEAEAMLSEKKVVSGAVNIQENANKMKEMKAFWMPSKTPEAQRLLEKPDMSTYCPATGKKLRLKDLIPIRFTRCAEDEEGFAKDPVTKDTFTNANRLVVLKGTGDVMLHETYTSCILPDGVYEGKTLKPGDVIELQIGGTGFSLHDGKATQAKKFFQLGPGSGRQDLRGQTQAARSLGGLVFNN